MSCDYFYNKEPYLPQSLAFFVMTQSDDEISGWTKSQLIELLKEAIRLAGNPSLLTPGLIETLVEHAVGSPRVMMNLAGEYFAIGMFKEAKQLDEGVFFELFPPNNPNGSSRRKSHSMQTK